MGLDRDGRHRIAIIRMADQHFVSLRFARRDADNLRGTHMAVAPGVNRLNRIGIAAGLGPKFDRFVGADDGVGADRNRGIAFVNGRHGIRYSHLFGRQHATFGRGNVTPETVAGGDAAHGHGIGRAYELDAAVLMFLMIPGVCRIVAQVTGAVHQTDAEIIVAAETVCAQNRRQFRMTVTDR